MDDATFANDEKRSRRFAVVAVALWLVMALLSSLGPFVVWIVGGMASYCSFLYFYSMPRQVRQPFSHGRHDEYTSGRPTVNVRLGSKQIVIGVVAVVIFIFLGLMVIGIIVGSDADAENGGANGEAWSNSDSGASDLDGLINRGNEFYNDGRLDSALYYYDKALSLDPDNHSGIYNKALVYHERKEYDVSIEMLTRLAEADPSNADALMLLGNNYYESERYDEAFQWYNRAYGAGKRDAFLSHALAYLYDEKKNNPGQALFFYKEALQLDSSRVEIYQRLAELEPSMADFYHRKARSRER